MAYATRASVSGACWINSDDRISVSGCSTDAIFGVRGIGSPHGHAVLFNDELVYNRQVSGLKAVVSEGRIIIEKEEKDKPSEETSD